MGKIKELDISDISILLAVISLIVSVVLYASNISHRLDIIDKKLNYILKTPDSIKSYINEKCK